MLQSCSNFIKQRVEYFKLSSQYKSISLIPRKDQGIYLIFETAIIIIIIIIRRTFY